MRSLVLASLALLVIVFGFIGFGQLLPSESGFDSLYRSVQLFVFGGGTGTNPNAWLEIARFVAPFVVGYAALQAIVALYREQFDLLRFRGSRNHVVIAGAGTAGFTTAAAFDRDEWPVIVIEQDASNAAIKGCRERGIGVLVGDATDPHILRKAGLAHAILLVVMCGDDGTNLDVSAAARGIARERSRGVVTVLAELDDLQLWQRMRAQALFDRDHAGFRLELFNNYALAAEMLLDEYPPFEDEATCPHVLVAGTDSVASSLVLDIVQRWLRRKHSEGSVLRVTIAAREANAARAELIARYPEIESVPACEVLAWEADLAGQRLVQLPAQFTCVYVSSASDTETLTVALSVRHHPQLDQDVGIVIAVADDQAGVGAAIARGGPAFGRVSAFGVLRQCLTPNALLYTTTERIAQLSHELHRQHQLSRAADPSDPSLLPWTDLPEALRESNRLFADGIGAKLARLGCVVIPAPLLDPRGPLLELSAEEVESLAPSEHERWETHMKRLGYKHGETKDHERKRHPMIGVPYAELPAENKDKDRAHVRAIPEILAHAGLQIRRASQLTGETAAHDNHAVQLNR